MGKKQVKRKAVNKAIVIPPQIEQLEKKKQMKGRTIKFEVGEHAGKYIVVSLKQVYQLALLGFDNYEFADFYNVKYETWTQWCNESAKTFKPELAETLRYARHVVVGQLSDRLMQRAMGYKHKATKFIVINGELRKEQYIEHYPPDTAAATFIMKNKRAKDWKDKQIIEGSADGPPVGQTVVNVITTDEKLNKLKADKAKKENKK